MLVLAAVSALVLFASAVLTMHYRRLPAYPVDRPVPVCPTRPGVALDELLTEATVVDYEVRIVEVVALDDEIIVGTSQGMFHLHLPWPFARQQALDRLHLWRLSGTRLVAFHAPAHGLAGVADEHSGYYLCAPAEA